VYAVGRIVQDSEISSGAVKLNEASLCLETSRRIGGGSRVPLKFDVGVKIRGAPRGQCSFGLFPGAIVALKGRNGGAGWFLVTEVLSVSGNSLIL